MARKEMMAMMMPGDMMTESDHGRNDTEKITQVANKKFCDRAQDLEVDVPDSLINPKTIQFAIACRLSGSMIRRWSLSW